jgi:ATP-dependent helicase/nuclease subunit A
MPRPRKNIALSASAGTGKTYRLALRYLALLAAGVPPDRICALTFSRKAAGEILDKIVEQLCGAAGSPRQRAAIGAGIAQEGLGTVPANTPAAYLALLRTLIESQHRLRIGTLDSFLLSIVRTFPFELGVPPDIQPMDGEGGEAQTQRQALLLRLLDPTHRTGAAGDQARTALLDALREARFGRAAKSLGQGVESIIAEDSGFFLDHNAPGIAWGVPDRIWPPPPPWWAPTRVPIPADLPENLVDAFGTEARARQLGHAVAAIADAALHHAPDKPWPADITKSSAFGQLCEAARDGLPELELSYYKKRYPLTRALWHPLRAALANLFRIEVERACRATAGRHRLLTLYDGLYREAQRADGRYTFEDLARLLGDPRHLPSRQDGATDRLYIDYRLDGELDHWLLDEFQDTSNMQWAAIRNLVDEVVQDPHRSFFYVGDVKQSIYGWRGGNHRLFGQVLADAAGGIDQGEPMIVCHRSVPAIIDTVNRVFDGLPAWRPAASGVTGPRAGAIHDFVAQWGTHQSAHPEDQAGFAALLEYEPKKNGERPADDEEADDDPAEFEAVADVLRTTAPLQRGFSVAVLVRSNLEGRRCVDVLRRKLPAVPVVHEGTGGIVDIPVVTVLLALARYAAHPGDTVARRHLQMSPLGAGLAGEAWDRLPGEFLSGIQNTGFAVQLRHWGARLGELDAFGRQRLAELCAVAEPFDATGSRDADAFCACVMEARLKNFAAAGVVRVMTVHQSKGLGFDQVIVPFSARSKSFGAPGDPDFLAAADWVLKPPLKVVLETAGGPPLEAVEAARSQANFSQLCVLYVALTRAKRALYMIVPEPAASVTVMREADLLRDRLAGAGGGGDGAGGLARLFACGDPEWYAQAPARAAAAPLPAAGPVPVVFEPRLVRHEPSKELGAARTLSAQWIFSLESGDVRVFGSALHGLFQKIEWLETTDIDQLITEWRASAAGSPAILRDVERQFRECLARDEVRRCLARPAGDAVVWTEAPFDLLVERDGERRILSGRFDRLVINRDAAGRVTGATVVDFKSDRVKTEGELRERVAGHMAQMRDYAQVAAELLGLAPDAVKGVLLFTRIGRVVAVG